MSNPLLQLFEDDELCARVQRKLPQLFQIAEIQASRAGRAGMEVGTLREQILVALLVLRFGEDNVRTEFPITTPEVDVEVLGRSVAIKTKTGLGYSGVKLVWTVDWERVEEFAATYSPTADILLARIRWNGEGSLQLITREAQQEVFRALGRQRYLRLPRRGTNPRGVELSAEALRVLLEHSTTRSIAINWTRDAGLSERPYTRWLSLWKDD